MEATQQKIKGKSCARCTQRDAWYPPSILGTHLKNKSLSLWQLRWDLKYYPEQNKPESEEPLQGNTHSVYIRNKSTNSMSKTTSNMSWILKYISESARSGVGNRKS